jgi:hypothetical protein
MFASSPVLRRACSTLLLLGAASCATPSDVKEASAEQLVLLDEMQRSLRELDAALVDVPKFDAAALAERLSIARAEGVPDETSPSERLGALNDPELRAALTGAAEPAAKSAPDAELIEILRAQLALLASASRVLDRYLSTDVVGEEQVIALRKLVASAQEGLR